MPFSDLILNAVAQRTGQPGLLGQGKRSPLRGTVTTALTAAAVIGFIALTYQLRPLTSTEPPKSAQLAVAGPAATIPVTPINSTAKPEDPESRPLGQYQAPKAEDPGGTSGSLLVKLGADLAIVVALVLLCAVGWKKLRGSLPLVRVEPSQMIRLESTVSLASQRFLHLVEIGGRRLVLASTPQQVTFVAFVGETESEPNLNEPAQIEPEQGEVSSDWFQNVLSKLDARDSNVGAAAAVSLEPVNVAVASVTERIAAAAPNKVGLFQFTGSNRE